MEKTVLAPAPGGLPLFDPDGDRPYEFAIGKRVALYVSDYTLRYLTRVGEDTWDVRLAIQHHLNPSNAATFVPAGATLTSPDFPGSTYRLDVNPASPTFLRLRHDAVTPELAGLGIETGDVVSRPLGLHASDGVLEYEYVWAPDATASYLTAGGEYVQLSGGRTLFAHLRNRAGKERLYHVGSYGSAIHVPAAQEMEAALRESGYVMTPEIAAKVVLFPSGTELTDPLDPGRHFIAKQRDVDQYLVPTTAVPALDLTAASALRSLGLPEFYEPSPKMPWGISPTEEEAPLKYVEGRRVQ